MITNWKQNPEFLKEILDLIRTHSYGATAALMSPKVGKKLTGDVIRNLFRWIGGPKPLLILPDDRDVVVGIKDLEVIPNPMLPTCPKCGSSEIYKRKEDEFYHCDQCLHKFPHSIPVDIEIATAGVKLAQQRQRFQDSNRIERKHFREWARLVNALEAYNKSLISRFDQVDLGQATILHEEIEGTPVGLLQLSDLHFNELIEETPSLPNQYDFHIAARRLKKLAMHSKKYFDAWGVKKVVVIMTGDLLNSDRRLDELLHMATNRSDASLLAVELISQFLLDLNQHYNLQVCNVSGNESRMTEYAELSELMARDNYDWTIYNFLAREFRNSEGIIFQADQDARENVIDINGQNVLYLHGESLPNMSGLEKKIQNLVGQWADKGVLVDFVICGHFHSARIGDTYSRSSSLAGPNTYSEDKLQLVSKASQNIHIFHNKHDRDSVRIGLHNTDGIEGYKIIDLLEAYHVKSAHKMRDRKTIFEVVV